MEIFGWRRNFGYIHSECKVILQRMNNERQNRYIALIIIATLIAFFPTIRNGFTNWDDGFYLLNNKDITSLSVDHLQTMFSSFYVAQYVPLVVLSFALEYHFFGLDPFVIHFASLFFHLLTTVMVYSIVRQWKFSDRIAFVTALLFGIHPLHVEPVAWVSATKDTLSGLFLTASLLAYYRYDETQKQPLYIISLLLFLCALCSKATMMFLPFFLIVEMLVNGRLTIPKASKLIPFFILSVIFASLAVYSLNSVNGLHLGKKFSLIETISIAGYNIFFYIFKTLFPVGLSSVYPFPVKIDGVLPSEFYFAPVAIFILLLCGIYFRKKISTFIIPLLFFLIALLPTVQIVSFGSMFAADRFVYLSLIGVLVIAAVIGEIIFGKVFSKRWEPILAATVIVVVLVIMTWNRLSIWNNSETLWTDAIHRYPDFPISYFSRGQYYFSRGDNEKAMTDFDKAVALAPNYPHALNMRGFLYAISGEKAKARMDFDKVLQLQPEHSVAHYNRGLLLMQENKLDSAYADFSSAIINDSAFTEAYIHRGLILMRQSKFRQAREDFSSALRMEPENIQALVGRGTASLKLSQLNDAINDLRHAHAVDPSQKETNFAMSLLFTELGKKDSAQYYFEKAGELRP